MLPRPLPPPLPQTQDSPAEVIGKHLRSSTTEGPCKKGPGAPTGPTTQEPPAQPPLASAEPTSMVATTTAPHTVPTGELRPTCPMPLRAPLGAAEVHLLLKFDPTNFDGLPTAKDGNPHLWRTRRGPTPTLPKLTTRIYTDTEFPHTHIPA
ncbi:hypothetical protein BD309DRAFT_839521, partial [Dichomitus squalens]